MTRENEGTPELRRDEIDLEKVADVSDTKSKVNGKDEAIDLEKAIELLGFGRFHAGLIIICGLGLVSMVQETSGMSFILPAAQCDLALTTTEKGYLSGMTFLGMVLSAHTWGFCADIFGRRKVLLISTCGSWIFSFASSFTPTSTLFIIFRFLTGLFLCGTSSTVYAYLSEFLPAYNRSKIMTWTCGFVAGAFLLIPSIAWLLLPVKISWDLGFVIFKSWRIYVIMMGCLTMIEGLVFYNFPETPKFLMSVGKKHEALEVLRYIYALNSGNSPDLYPVKNLKFEITGYEDDGNETSSNVTPKLSFTFKNLGQIIWRQTAPLFQKPYGLVTLLFCTIQFGLYASASGMYLWMPNILNIMTSMENSDLTTESGPETICEFMSYEKNINSYNSMKLTNSSEECSDLIKDEVYMSTLVVGAFYVVTYTTFGGLVSLFGKQTVLVSAQVISGIAGIGAYFARDGITVTLLMSGYIVFSGTCVSVLSAAVVDAYPTNLRAMAVSLALTCGRLGSGVAGNVVGALINANCDLTIIGMGCMTMGCGLLCFLLRK